MRNRIIAKAVFVGTWRGVFVVLRRLMESANFMLEFVVTVVSMVLISGVIGAMIIAVGPWLINLPETIAILMTLECVKTGVCDYTTGAISLVVAVIVIASVGLVFWRVWSYELPQEASPFENVKETIMAAKEKGITPARVAEIAELSRVDTDRILAALFDDGLIDCRKSENGNGRVVYFWKDKKHDREVHKLDQPAGRP
jgi:hypothetical protein